MVVSIDEGTQVLLSLLENSILYSFTIDFLVDKCRKGAIPVRPSVLDLIYRNFGISFQGH